LSLLIRRLRADDDRSGFRCGDIDLDRFFQRYAGQNQFRHQIGVTYVAVEERRIVGFATVAPSEIDISALPDTARRHLPRFSLPVLRLARMAVDARDQRRGIGLALLRSVFVLAREMAVALGCVGLVVDAKPDAVNYYARFGFVVLQTLQGHLGDRPRPVPMFLEIGAIPDTSAEPPGP